VTDDQYPTEDPTCEWAEEYAKSKGCRVVYPAINQLQLDIDTDAAFGEFVRRLTDLRKWGRMESMPEMVITPSKSGLPHRHITLTFDRDFDRWERIALQMLLGSDPVREKMNVLRTLRANPQPVRLFEPVMPDVSEWSW